MKNTLYEEIGRAVKAHGGVVTLYDDSDPVHAKVMASARHCDCWEEFYVTRVEVAGDGDVTIYGFNENEDYDPECGYWGAELEYLSVNELDYLLDHIPETDEVKDVTTPIDSMNLLTVCREDVASAGFDSEAMTDWQFEKVVEHMEMVVAETSMDDFWNSLRTGCEDNGVPKLEKTEEDED